MCRAWPSLSAKTVAQKPGDSVIPPLSPTQGFEVAVGAGWVVCASDGTAIVENNPAATSTARFFNRLLSDLG
jgi:hypothetical protein